MSRTKTLDDVQMICPKCKGSGRINLSELCNVCKGTGRLVVATGLPKHEHKKLYETF